jgi:hypothetical protein
MTGPLHRDQVKLIHQGLEPQAKQAIAGGVKADVAAPPIVLVGSLRRPKLSFTMRCPR